MDFIDAQKYIIGDINTNDLCNELHKLLNQYLFKIKQYGFDKDYNRELETYAIIIEIFINQLRLLLTNKNNYSEIIKTSIFLGTLLESTFQFFFLAYKSDYKKEGRYKIERLGISDIKDILIEDKIFSIDNLTDSNIIETIESINSNRNVVHIFNKKYKLVYEELINNIKNYYYLLDSLLFRIEKNLEQYNL